jgi:ParB-like chromosome segregation protein Spo0J
MSSEESRVIEVAPCELGEALAAVRLCAPGAQQEMQQSLAKLGQLCPLLAFRTEARPEIFDGLKRLRAARALGMAALRVEVHAIDAAGAKVRVLRCNAAASLTELEEAWLVRSLYREDGLLQPQIAVLLGRDKSWVCRRLALAEDLSDELTASVRLGLLSATACRELCRLPRGNQEAIAQVVAQRGLTTRQTARLVEALLRAPAEQWPTLLAQAARSLSTAAAGHKRRPPRRTPGEQLAADAWNMKQLASRLHARLLERSLQSLGEGGCAVVSAELTELRAALAALTATLDKRLTERGAHHAAA